MSEPAWSLSCTNDPQRRARTKRDGRLRLSSAHARDFYAVHPFFADAHTQSEIDAARARIEHAKAGTVGGKLGGHPKLAAGIWKYAAVNGHLSEAEQAADREQKIAWMLQRYQENRQTMTGVKAVREMLRDGVTMEKVSIPGGIASLTPKRIDYFRMQCNEALKTP